MPKTVLAIDDDLGNLKVLQSRLGKEGFKVVVAIDGEGGLKKLEEIMPDLIILDVKMPNMNGYTFMLELRKLKKFDAVPIIVLTSYNEMEPIFKFNNVRDFIVKPVNFDTLFEKINACLKG